MAVSLLGKIIITIVVLGVIAGMTVTIVLIVNDDNNGDPVEGTTEGTQGTDEDGGIPGTTPSPGDHMPYEVGVGIADMTGPCAEITFMGYAELGQRGEGIHLRQYARSFIFKKGDTRIVLVTAEVQAVGIAVRREVVRKLQEEYGDIYTLRNVIITGTHTHSAPGGTLVDFILDISILGFSSETFNAYVDGITRVCDVIIIT
ncbi:neutral ceramidase-like [Pectinophora gossypiella]|uniref:neutral ceramidase-like n=1 Tax=Pectinophora gossypiella TaxID=13191 RepID=UPI00214E09B4|nr:neutral ceramidase-like [Pectinophora gossypiella]